MSSKFQYVQESNHLSHPYPTSTFLHHQQSSATTVQMHPQQQQHHHRLKHHHQQHYLATHQTQAKYAHHSYHQPVGPPAPSLSLPSQQSHNNKQQRDLSSTSMMSRSGNVAVSSDDTYHNQSADHKTILSTDGCFFGPLIENEEYEEGELSCDVNENENEKSSLFNSSWIFSDDFIQNRTPSRLHGISYGEEIEFRRKGTTFIRDLTKLLKMKPICKETAYVYFHRFYMLRSFKQYEPIRIAMASLYFACKYEDHPLCKDYLIQVSYLLVNNYVGKQQTQPHNKLSKDDKEYVEYCDRLIMDENMMIQILGFDNLRVSHFQVLVVESYSKHPIAGTTQELYTAAYQIASELNRLTILCVEYTAPILASVSIYLASCYKMVTLPDDWCQTIIPDLKNLSETKKLVIKISEQYRDILASSQLIRKMLSEEYLRLYGPSMIHKKTIQNNRRQQASTDYKNQQKNQSLGLLLNNFSPDSAYSSSSSTTAAYSPAEQPATTKANASGDRIHRIFHQTSNNGGQTATNITLSSSSDSVNRNMKVIALAQPLSLENNFGTTASLRYSNTYRNNNSSPNHHVNKRAANQNGQYDHGDCQQDQFDMFDYQSSHAANINRPTTRQQPSLIQNNSNKKFKSTHQAGMAMLMSTMNQDQHPQHISQQQLQDAKNDSVYYRQKHLLQQQQLQSYYQQLDTNSGAATNAAPIHSSSSSLTMYHRKN